MPLQHPSALYLVYKSATNSTHNYGEIIPLVSTKDARLRQPGTPVVSTTTTTCIPALQREASYSYTVKAWVHWTAVPAVLTACAFVRVDLLADSAATGRSWELVQPRRLEHCWVLLPVYAAACVAPNESLG